MPITIATNTTTCTAWSAWASDVIDMTATTTACTDEVWLQWAGTAGYINTGTPYTNTSATTTGTDAWTTWVSTEAHYIEPISDEVRQEQRRQRSAELLERVKQKQERKTKAVTLLRDALSIEQRNEFDRHDYFYVTGGDSGKKYRIDNGRAGNVKLVDNKLKPQQSLCAHPAITCPNEDTMLVQKVMLEHMEGHFIDTANVTIH